MTDICDLRTLCQGLRRVAELLDDAQVLLDHTLDAGGLCRPGDDCPDLRTAAACIRTGRHYLGWEQDSGYYEQMQERLKTVMSISEGPCDRPPRAVLPLGSRLHRTTMQAAQLCFSDGL